MTPECKLILTGKLNWDDASEAARTEATPHIEDAAWEIFKAPWHKREKMLEKIPVDMRVFIRIAIEMIRYTTEERAAIKEHDGNISREQAENQALSEQAALMSRN